MCAVDFLLVVLVGAEVATVPEIGGAEAPPAASAQAGRELFIGSRRLAAGGPPCGACHAVLGEGPAFSGSLGPELSASLGEMDAAAIDGLLELLPFPTMTPVYAGRPLTAGERADLAVFLGAGAVHGRPRPASDLVIPVLLLVGAYLSAVAVLAHRRKAPTRAPLVARPRVERGGIR